VKSEEWRVESEELIDRHAKHLVGLGAVLRIDPFIKCLPVPEALR